MLKALNFYKDLVDSGAAPKRVATIKNYDDFNAAAIAGHAGDVHRRSLAALPAQGSRCRRTNSPNGRSPSIPGPTADERSTGTGGWTFAALSKDPAKVKFCMDLVREVYMGPANEVMGQLPTRKSLFASLDAFKDPFFTIVNEYLVHGQARPGVPIYPGDLQPDPDHDGRGPLRHKASRAGARRRLEGTLTTPTRRCRLASWRPAARGRPPSSEGSEPRHIGGA